MRFLVIGAGGAGGIHVKELAQRGHEVSVHDIDAEKAQTVAARYNVRFVEDTTADYDCSVVAVPAYGHYEVARAEAMSGRKAIVCEKPLCLHQEEAEELVALTTAKGVGLLVAESQCYAGEDGLEVARMRDRIAAGGFGKPVIWRVCAMTSYRPQPWCNDMDVGGGAFIEGGIHVLTTARVLFGEAVKWQGSVRCFSGGTGPDSGTFLVDYAEGHQLLLQIGWGTEGCFSGECSPLPNSFGLFGPEECEAWWPGDNHSAMWGHLLKCLEGEAEPVATADHAAGAVADAWKCYEAAGVRKHAN